MNKRIIRSRRARYGTMTLVLTVLLVTVVVLFNAVFGTLAGRYSWYVDLNGSLNYEVSENCLTLLDSVLSSQQEQVEIIFCDTQEKWTSDFTQRSLYNTASQIAERFPQKVTVSCYNIRLNPTPVKSYTKAFNPSTGAYEERGLTTTDIVIRCGTYYRTYDLREFFVFEGNQTSNPWAYGGERKLAAGILHAVHPNGGSVCMMKNHGEIYYDYELLYLLDDAGYSIKHIDLYREEIPADCTLLISYNPNSDLTVSDSVSAKSEADKLEQFLAKSGNTVLFFLESGTPNLPNMEAFLSGWGVETCYAKSNTANRTYRYTVQDSTQSLTSDGYTIYGQPSGNEHINSFLGVSPEYVVFKNATALKASNGFVSQSDGSYKKENRTLYSVFESGKNTISWANGVAVDNSTAMLMTLTEQTNADSGVSRVGVVSSVQFASEGFLQSAVYGNTDTLMRVCRSLGMKSAPVGLTIKPFQSTDISVITTAQILRWTLFLALLPAIVVPSVATVVLIRRKNR